MTLNELYILISAFIVNRGSLLVILSHPQKPQMLQMGKKTLQ